MVDSINITDCAKAQISKLSHQHNKHVRLAVVSGGCNGFSKSWSFDDTMYDDDIKYDCIDSLLLVDSTSFDILKNCTIDYKTDLIGSYFTIDVPAASSSCGCGTSFSI